MSARNWSNEQFLQFFDTLPMHEQRQVEWKVGKSSQDEKYRLRVVRAVMAMSNLPDGGHLLLGPTNSDRTIIRWESDADRNTWSADQLGGLLERFCTEPPAFIMRERPVDGGVLIHIDVEPFDLFPTACKCSSGDPAQILTAGCVYVRSAGQSKSVAAVTQGDWRLVMDAYFSLELTRRQGVNRDLAPAAPVDRLTTRMKEFFA
jgi:hypothetical protein